MTIKLVTVGVYGFSEEAFFQALQDAKIDAFCDIRWRRGVRGAQYAFANSQRLQNRLAELGIHYLHRRDLAPSPAVRRLQTDTDTKNKVAKRKRNTLSDNFAQAYEEEVLTNFESSSFMEDLPPNANVVALFCVEAEPAACQRSLLAQKLQHDLEVEVEHLVPQRNRLS